MKTDLEKLARTILFPFDSEDRKQDISEMKPTAEERLTAEEYFVRQYPVYTIRGEHIPNEITLFKEELFRMMQEFAAQEIEAEIEKRMPSKEIIKDIAKEHSHYNHQGFYVFDDKFDEFAQVILLEFRNRMKGDNK